jgi:antitoxin component of MazEF toxin-antitoxin module
MRVTVIKIRKIGNSKGILLPNAILDQVGIIDAAKITVKDRVILISSRDTKAKKSWSDFKIVRRKRVDFVSNSFDRKAWTW